MQTIIMAAGKGTRMGEITKSLPKPLLGINNRPMLSHTLDALPEQIDEILLVVHHHADQVRNALGDSHNGKKITYVFQENLTGTATAVWVAQPYLRSERFLILSGDDWYPAEDLIRLIQHPLSIGVHEVNDFISDMDLGIDKDQYARRDEKLFATKTKYVATGAYVMDHRLFERQPVQFHNGEFGLPHTIMQMTDTLDVKAVLQPNWLPMNTVEHWESIKQKLEA